MRTLQLVDSYEHARQIKNKQDDYCSKVFADEWEGLGEFPEELQWEALVDILRGKVKVNTLLGTKAVRETNTSSGSNALL